MQEYFICKSNSNSYHDGTSTFFNVFFEKDLHLNAAERMCYNRYLNNKIDRLYESCFQTINNDKTLTFNDQLIENDGPASIHKQNIQQLAIELFQFFNGLSPEIIKEIFQFPDELPQMVSALYLPKNILFDDLESIIFFSTKYIRELV